MISDLIKTLTLPERERLQKIAGHNANLKYRIIQLILDHPTISNAEIERRLKISPSSCAKNISLAKQEIYALIKHENKTSYDDIFLVQQLILRGLYTQAAPLMEKLEIRYREKQWYALLDALYHEAFRMAYHNGNIRALEKINQKAKENLACYLQYSALDNQLLLDMAKCEKLDVSPKQVAPYLIHLEKLYSDCKKAAHYVLEFNALHCLYEIHTNYTNDFLKVTDILQKIKEVIECNKEKTNEATYSTMLTHIAFPYCVYELEESPEVYFDYLSHYFGSNQNYFILSEVLLNYAVYYFTLKNNSKLKEIGDLLEKNASDKSNNYKGRFVTCLLSFAQKDDKDFHRHKNEFYAAESNRNTKHCDIMLRYLEIILLLNSHAFETASAKIEATEKFLQRNFSVAKIVSDKILLRAFRKRLKRKAIKPGAPQIFRFNNYLLRELN